MHEFYELHLDKRIVVLALAWWVGRRRVFDDLHIIAHLFLVAVAAVLLVRDRLDGLAEVAVISSWCC